MSARIQVTTDPKSLAKVCDTETRPYSVRCQQPCEAHLDLVIDKAEEAPILSLLNQCNLEHRTLLLRSSLQ